MNSSYFKLGLAQHLKQSDFATLHTLIEQSDEDGNVNTDGKGLYKFLTMNTGLSQMTVYHSLNRLELLDIVKIKRNQTKHGQRLANTIKVNLEQLGLQEVE